jgi:hypothetical protein
VVDKGGRSCFQALLVPAPLSPHAFEHCLRVHRDCVGMDIPASVAACASFVILLYISVLLTDSVIQKDRSPVLFLLEWPLTCARNMVDSQ